MDIFDSSNLFTINISFQQKALVIAALCHDVDHPGFTNNFLQVTNHVLANLYEESVLENHHYMVAMMIIKVTHSFVVTILVVFWTKTEIV